MDELLDALLCRQQSFQKRSASHGEALRRWFESLDVESRRSILRLEGSFLERLAQRGRIGEVDKLVQKGTSHSSSKGLLRWLPPTGQFSLTDEGNNDFDANLDDLGLDQEMLELLETAPEEFLFKRHIGSTNRMLSFCEILSERERLHFQTSHWLCTNACTITRLGQQSYIELDRLADNPQELWQTLDILSYGMALSEEDSRATTSNQGKERKAVPKMFWFESFAWASLGMVVANLLEVQLHQAFAELRGAKRDKEKRLQTDSSVRMVRDSLKYWRSLDEKTRLNICATKGVAKHISTPLLRFRTRVEECSTPSSLKDMSSYYVEHQDLEVGEFIHKEAYKRDLQFDILDALRIASHSTLRGKMEFQKALEPLGALICLVSSRRPVHQQPSLASAGSLQAEVHNLILENIVVPEHQEHVVSSLLQEEAGVSKKFGQRKSKKPTKKSKQKHKKPKHAAAYEQVKVPETSVEKTSSICRRVSIARSDDVKSNPGTSENRQSRAATASFRSVRSARTRQTQQELTQSSARQSKPKRKHGSTQEKRFSKVHGRRKSEPTGMNNASGGFYFNKPSTFQALDDSEDSQDNENTAKGELEDDVEADRKHFRDEHLEFLEDGARFAGDEGEEQIEDGFSSYIEYDDSDSQIGSAGGLSYTSDLEDHEVSSAEEEVQDYGHTQRDRGDGGRGHGREEDEAESDPPGHVAFLPSSIGFHPGIAEEHLQAGSRSSGQSSEDELDATNSLALFPPDRIHAIWARSPGGDANFHLDNSLHSEDRESVIPSPAPPPVFSWSNPFSSTATTSTNNDDQHQPLFGTLFGPFKSHRNVSTQTEPDKALAYSSSVAIQTPIPKRQRPSKRLVTKSSEPSDKQGKRQSSDRQEKQRGRILLQAEEESHSDGGEWTTISKRHRRRPFSADGRGNNSRHRTMENSSTSDQSVTLSAGRQEKIPRTSSSQQLIRVGSFKRQGADLGAGLGLHDVHEKAQVQGHAQVSRKPSYLDVTSSVTAASHTRSESSSTSSQIFDPKSCPCCPQLGQVLEELKQVKTNENVTQQSIAVLQAKIDDLADMLKSIQFSERGVASQRQRANSTVETGEKEVPKMQEPNKRPLTGSDISTSPTSPEQSDVLRHKDNLAETDSVQRPHTSWSHGGYHGPGALGYPMLNPVHPMHQYTMYYNTNAAGVLFTDPYFYAVPDPHHAAVQQLQQQQHQSGYTVSPQQTLRRRLAVPFPHEWHGREYMNTVDYSSHVEQDPTSGIYRTSSARALSSLNEVRSGDSPDPSQQEEIPKQGGVWAHGAGTDGRPPRFLDGPTRLSNEILSFANECFGERQKRLPTEMEVLNKLSLVVKHLWPRATVKRFGSCVTGLALPDGDIDLVICLPKVMQDEIADEPGPLEGRNAIKMSWQQNLAEALQLVSWIEPDSMKTILHAPIPIIKLSTKGPPHHPRELHLDISFQAENHNGLATNKLVSGFCKEFPSLPPLVLVLKQFLARRGLGRGYTGGLSSYGLVLVVVCFLRNTIGQKTAEQHPVVGRSPRNGTSRSLNRSRSNSHEPFGLDTGKNEYDIGYLLVRFLKFYGDTRLFNPSTTGVSLSKGFFDRKSNTYGDGSNSTCETESLPGTRRQVNAQLRQRHQKQRLDNSSRFQSFHTFQSQLSMVPAGQLSDDSRSLGSEAMVDSHRFDPIFIDDPLQPGNNVGRNCFRIAAIQRAWLDAGDCLRRAMLKGHQRKSLLEAIINPQEQLNTN